LLTIARNICNKLILNAKTKYYSSISEKNHTETTGSKNWWNLVKSLLGDSNNRSPHSHRIYTPTELSLDEI
jgi:hypothetical protein